MKKSPYQPSPGVGVGLIWFLIFLLCFYFVGYKLIFSVFLALIGGLATGLIGDWWVAKEDPNLNKAKEPELQDEEIGVFQPPRLQRVDREGALKRYYPENQPTLKIPKLAKLKIPFRRGKSRSSNSVDQG